MKGKGKYLNVLLFCLSAGATFLPVVKLADTGISLFDVLRISKGDLTERFGELGDILQEYAGRYARMILVLYLLILGCILICLILKGWRTYAAAAAGAVIINGAAAVAVHEIWPRVKELKAGLDFFGFEEYVALQKGPVCLWFLCYAAILIIGIGGAWVYRPKPKDEEIMDLAAENSGRGAPSQNNGNMPTERVPIHRERYPGGGEKPTELVNEERYPGGGNIPTEQVHGKSTPDGGEKPTELVNEERCPGGGNIPTEQVRGESAPDGGEKPTELVNEERYPGSGDQPTEQVRRESAPGGRAFYGAILGKQEIYRGKAFVMEDGAPVYVCLKDGTEYISRRREQALAQIDYEKERGGYCVTPLGSEACHLEGGQILEQEKRYYIPRGTHLYFRKSSEGFVLA